MQVKAQRRKSTIRFRSLVASRYDLYRPRRISEIPFDSERYF
jgi:hypothetical protein